MTNPVGNCDTEQLSAAWTVVEKCASQTTAITDFLKSTLCTVKDTVVCPTANAVNSVFNKHIGWLAFFIGTTLVLKGVSNLTHLAVEKAANKKRELQTKAILQLGLGIIGVAAGTGLIV